MAGKDKWMKWRRELMDSCGQCVGFRAKGLELPTAEEGHVCKPNEACPKHCPGFQMDFDEIAKEISVGQKDNKTVISTEEVSESNNNEKHSNIQVHCYKCGKSDEQGFLLPIRHAGESQWVCTKCLPSLIHG